MENASQKAGDAPCKLFDKIEHNTKIWRQLEGHRGEERLVV